MIRFNLAAAILAVPLWLSGLTQATAQDDLRAAIAGDYQRNLEALFVHFHENPELSHREFETSKRLAAEIRALGFEVTEGVGGTGVVAVLENGPGPTVMVRADMDGLPVREQSGLAYASEATQQDIDGEIKPVMHACGHDTHITSLVGTARQMAARTGQWSGTLVLIGQPAEERISGARRMLEDGLYQRFPKNDRASAERVRDVVTGAFGQDVLWEQPREGMGAEDFAYFVTPESGVKGVYFSVGGTLPENLDTAAGHHSPMFRIEPEPAITVATEAMVRAAIDLFGNARPAPGA